jgi:DEAD/DEAH box helicase domain-containing protein
MDNRQKIAKFLTDERFGKNIAAVRDIPARSGDFSPIPPSLSISIRSVLSRQKIRELYSHQSQAIEAFQDGKHLAIVTGVASGKSLCYQLPALDIWLQNRQARTMFLFPTKALAQDQKRELAGLLSKVMEESGAVCGGIGIYDGDTPASQRKLISENSNFVFTNPDMLHLGIMPHHTRWANFFANLRLVVIDEVHLYRGIFGSHFTNVIRRLKRIASFYGADPQFICTSATLANTQEFITRLIEEDVFVIDKDSSPQGRKVYALYNPPLINSELSIRRSSMLETISLGEYFTQGAQQTIIFAHTRRLVELIVSYLQRNLREPDSVLGYRSGYLAQQRREIETLMKAGEINTVVATSALELGIDVGGLDVIVICGYPGSIASTLQQWGRAGRKQADSLGVLVAGNDLIDQYLVKHADYIFAGFPEQALINPDNPFILLHHFECALFEKPFRSGERFGNLSSDETTQYLDLLQKYGKVHKSGEKYLWRSDTYPAGSISLRTTGSGEYILQCEGEIIGKVDEASAYWMVHPQAVYIHNGISYLVEELDFAAKIARLRQESLDYYTQSISRSDYELLKELERKEVTGAWKFKGQVRVERQVTGFKRIKWGSQEILDQGSLDMPLTELVTTAYWFCPEDEIIESLKSSGDWNNSPNQYGEGWRRLTEKIRKRDEYSCVNCGIKESGAAFHVHHKIPFRQFINRYEANREENLITLCPACHRLAEQETYIQSSLAGLSWLLQNIAPLHLMCDRSDIGVDVQRNSNLAGGKPAIIIYDTTPGGIGLATRLYRQHQQILAEAKEIVSECNCKDGCPACTGPVSESGEGAKSKVIALLKLLVAEDV